jgi:hypothetical protein
LEILQILLGSLRQQLHVPAAAFLAVLVLHLVPKAALTKAQWLHPI